MTARLSFTQAQVRRNIAAAHKAGLRVAGIRPDGTVIVDNSEGGQPMPLETRQALPISKWEDVEA